MTAAAACVKKKPVVTVDWTASPSGSVTAYVVTRAKPPAAPVVVATLPASTTSWDDSSVALNTLYAYGVTASYLNWTSATPTASVTTAKKC